MLHRAFSVFKQIQLEMFRQSSDPCAWAFLRAFILSLTHPVGPGIAAHIVVQKQNRTVSVENEGLNPQALFIAMGGPKPGRTTAALKGQGAERLLRETLQPSACWRAKLWHRLLCLSLECC